MEQLKKLWTVIKRKWWYILLLIISSIYVWHYRLDIDELSPLNAQSLIFLLWLALLLLPLFSEMEFFGVKLKKEVEKAKSEVKESLSDLRLQIMDLKVSNSNANNIFIGNSLASKEELNEMLHDIKVPAEKEKGEREKGNPPEWKRELDVSEQSIFLFKVRSSLEKVLSEICEKTGYVGSQQYRHMLNHLSGIGILSSDAVKIIIQIQGITNRGIHGEIVSTEYIDFLDKAFPSVLKELKDANKDLNYCICPHCNYKGYALFANVCPKCGFVHDDD